MTLALTTLANVRESLQVPAADTSNDTYFSNLITRFSKLAENYIGRGDLTSAEATEGYKADGQLYLILRRFPVSAISAITVDGTALDSTTYKLLNGGRNGLVQRIGTEFTGQISTTFGPQRWPGGGPVDGNPERIQVTYTAGYTLSDVADLEQAAIESITMWIQRRLYAFNLNAEALGSYNYQSGKNPANLNGIPIPTETISIMNRYKEIPIC